MPQPVRTPRRPRRTVRLPTSRPIAEAISAVEADFHASGGFYFRVGVLALVAVAAFGLLALRLWSLQLIQGPSYARIAQQQVFRSVELPAPRGPIVDARGRILAATQGRVVVTIDAGALGKVDRHGVWWPSRQGRALLVRLGRLGQEPTGTLIRRVRRSQTRSPYAPAVVLSPVSPDLAAYLDERADRFPGALVTSLPERNYPQGGLGSEFLGLLGEIAPAELRDPRHRGVKPGQQIGQSGLEAAYDRLLNGGLRKARISVDAQGRAIGGARLVGRARPARQLQLTIDARMQRKAEQAIRDGIAYAHLAGHLDANAGAAVVMNPRDGSVYALASYPHFNQALAAHDARYLHQLYDPSNPARPLLDRATQGLYPTGSTFKPIVAEAALASGLISPYSVLPCTGSITVGGIVFHNVEPGINASLNLRQALSISCDTWFYQLGEMFYGRQAQTGSLDMQRWARQLGLGHPTGLDVPGEAGGVVPTPSWLRQTFREPWQRIWYEGYSVNLSIGQGYLAVTPLQLAVAYSALANGGTVVRPHVAQAVLDPAGNVIRKLSFPPRARLHLTDIWAIRDGLYDAAHSSGGTSTAIFGKFPVPVAGKTGTAQTSSGSDHSLYASWAPANDPRVVVVVLIEHGGFGVQAAAPAAREIYSAFFGLDRRPNRHPG